ncbi:MAG TPA: hypothetical protein DCR93_31935 [Cytophagales bacterium]|nr:hypothetical protein [Cytophagales bacterium]
MKHIQQGYLIFLLVVAVYMLLWGLAGFFEYFTGIEPGMPLQYSYPPALQFLHWLFLVLYGGFFLIGYIKRWRHTPQISVLLFSNGALLCTIETFDFKPDTWGMVPYLTEIGIYVISSIFLLRSPVARQRFSRG